jgi:hypothetical protein
VGDLTAPVRLEFAGEIFEREFFFGRDIREHEFFVGQIMVLRVATAFHDAASSFAAQWRHVALATLDDREQPIGP